VGSADHLAGLRGGVESSSIHPTLLMTCERLSRMRTACRKCMPGVRRLEWEAYVSC
jgi:hypothetical protein